MKLGDLIKENEYYSSIDIPCDLEIEDVSSNPNKIGDSTLFILIKSIKFDIKNIISYIETKKPRAIVCERDVRLDKFKGYILHVDNARSMLAHIYSRFFGIDYSKTTFIGVTGTNGKTSTATLLKNIIMNTGALCGFIGTGKIEIGKEIISEKNYSMTTPDPEVLYRSIKKMQNADCKYIVMEVSSHALYFDKLAPIPFKIGMFTNLSAEHLDFHKNEKEYFKSKIKLMLKSEIGIFNADDKYSKKAFTLFSGEKYTVGIFESADGMAKDIVECGFQKYEYIYKEKDLILKVSIPLPGIYNISNSMFAVKAARILGISRKHIKDALKDTKKIDGRFEIINQNPTVIIDYAHTELALINLLKTIKSIKKAEQNLILVFGCGGERDTQKRPLMAKAAEKYADFTIVTSDNSRGECETKIISDILKGFESSEKRRVIVSRKKAIEYAVLHASKNDIIAIVGKGHERYNIDKNGYTEFDEREIVRIALSERNECEDCINADTSRFTIELS